MRIVVTGGAGFIGANLVRGLLESDVDVRVTIVDDFSTGSAANLPSDDRIEVAKGSILDLEWLGSICTDHDSIVHLAAMPSVPRSIADPIAAHHANATGTLHVLEVARRTGAHVIVASSSSVYGANPELPKHEELVARPRSPYAASKLATEAYALAYAASFDVPVLPFRFFNVYGPLQAADHAYAAVVPRFIDAALAGRPLTIHGDGLQTRDFTYVGSVTRVLIDAVIHRATSDEAVNLAFGTRTSIIDLATRISSALDTDLRIEHVDPRAGDVRDSQADTRRLEALFPGMEPVALERGLDETIQWFRTADYD